MPVRGTNRTPPKGFDGAGGFSADGIVGLGVIGAEQKLSA
jgi:hypothetical protein